MSGTETTQAANECLEWAREHERMAREFRKIAAKIKDPPPGTRVEIGARCVRFVTEVAA